jgi:hypothetical protein
MTHMHGPRAADLVHVTVPTILKLISRTTEQGSEPRARRLFSLLGDGIIGTVWTYGGHDQTVISASFDVLPEVLNFAGILSARYLKVNPNFISAMSFVHGSAFFRRSFRSF